eukprot:CAMPEP_0178465310 /NCGR_PEP_ID=MMETSP0689_2-20121128/51295_1 /TAXON_ID=160604 /ORGANISM="Amphidinium massartii, Strain CS-259" /LENGTH=107 /DNA_ID=CAMNT_0020092245 /DNA_START=97 /DNA_END=416 /DNA_ORIENTATION=+
MSTCSCSKEALPMKHIPTPLAIVSISTIEITTPGPMPLASFQDALVDKSVGGKNTLSVHLTAFPLTFILALAIALHKPAVPMLHVVRPLPNVGLAFAWKGLRPEALP